MKPLDAVLCASVLAQTYLCQSSSSASTEEIVATPFTSTTTTTPLPTTDPNTATLNSTSNSSSIDVVQGEKDNERLELCRTYICGRWFMLLWESYIVQLPPEWWRDRYEGSAALACDTVMRQLDAELRLHMPLTGWECWEMDRRYPSGDIGWLQVRFNLELGPPFQHDVKRVIETVADPAGRRAVNMSCACPSFFNNRPPCHD